MAQGSVWPDFAVLPPPVAYNQSGFGQSPRLLAVQALREIEKPLAMGDKKVYHVVMAIRDAVVGEK